MPFVRGGSCRERRVEFRQAGLGDGAGESGRRDEGRPDERSSGRLFLVELLNRNQLLQGA